MNSTKSYSLAEVLQAQEALRKAAGLKPERFSTESFVGMVSDEIEALRKAGHQDSEIASLIRGSSEIHITEDEIRENYASPEARHGDHS